MLEAGRVEQSWRDYKQHGLATARDDLVLHYSGVVKYVASRISAELPGHVTTSDLVSYGVFGLIDAIERFDPDRGLQFQTYALQRIRGAIIDELRAIDWVPRSVRAKAKAVERAYQHLEGRLGRNPTDDELAFELDLTVTQLRRTLSDIARRGMISLDEGPASRSGNEAPAPADALVDLSEGPAEQAEASDVRRSLALEISRLPEREKVLLTLYYFEGLTLAQIGSVLGVTESRVSQMHTKAVLQLRSRMTKDEHEWV